MGEGKTMDTEAVVEALSKQLEKAKAILKTQPVEKDRCEKWTEETRKVLVEIYGAGSKEFRDFVAANRQILTSYELDPSYYLTQMVANLHREMRVLERCLKEKKDQLEAEQALAAIKGLKRKVVAKYNGVLWAENSSAAKQVTAFLEEKGFKLTVLGREKAKKDALWAMVSQPNVDYGVAILTAAKGRKTKSVSPDGLLVAGYLAGRLGRARTIVLVEKELKLPDTAAFLRAFPLEDVKAWQKEIETDLSKICS